MPLYCEGSQILVPVQNSTDVSVVREKKKWVLVLGWETSDKEGKGSGFMIFWATFFLNVWQYERSKYKNLAGFRPA